MVECLIGDPSAARQAARAAVREGASATAMAATVLALGGDISSARKAVAGLTDLNPGLMDGTQALVIGATAALELAEGAPAKAVEALKVSLPFEPVVGHQNVYLRGEAYRAMGAWREAAAEFQKLTARPGLLGTSLVYPMAHLGLARALAREDDTAGARAAYEKLFAIWKDADPDLRPLVEARREYAKLPAAPR